MTMPVRPTPYPEVNAVLAQLLAGVRDALGNRLIGVYLSGSLASGGFDPASSDIDFIAATATDLDQEQVNALTRMHRRLAGDGSHWATHIEGAYIPRRALRRYDPADCAAPTLAIGGRFSIEPQDWDGVLHRHIVREHGVVLAGSDPRTLIDPVSPADLRRATANLLTGWWTGQLHDPSLLRTRQYQAYAVLTMCRVIYTLEHGAIISKPAAARWARERLGPPYTAWIERAQRWRNDPTSDDRALPDALAFIRFTLGRAGHFPPPVQDER